MAKAPDIISHRCDKPTLCEKCIHVKSCRKVIILKNRTYKLIKYCSQGAERSEK